jgi:hypothetical protein
VEDGREVEIAVEQLTRVDAPSGMAIHEAGGEPAPEVFETVGEETVEGGNGPV